MRLLILLLLACSSVLAQQTPDTFALGGFEIASPQDGWTLRDADDFRVEFERNEPEPPVRLDASLLEIEAFPEDRLFFAFAEARHKAALDSVEMISAHYNTIRVKGMACLQYDGIYRDPTASESDRMLNTTGFTCRHPTIADHAIALDLREHAASVTATDRENLMALSRSFFESAVFAQ